MFDKLVDLFVQFVGLFQFWTIIDEYQMGVILRLGKFHKEIGPGLHWVIPFGVDRPIEMNTVTKLAELWPSTLTMRDGTTVSVNTIIRYKIKNIRKALLEVDHIMDAIKDSVTAHVARQVRASTWEEVNSPEFAEALPKECRKRAWRYGVEIEDVVFSDLCKVRALALIGNGSSQPQAAH